MNAARSLFALPLLARELNGRAIRWQHYAARVAFAVLVFGAFVWMTREVLRSSSIEDLGAGRDALVKILGLELYGICLFLPAMMCGVIAREVECRSLTQLLLTPMSVWSIVLQKYFGGLVPMLVLLLLASPLCAIAYALGGVTPMDLAFGFGMLVLTAMEVGAVALLASALCRNTTAAFMLTYVLGAVAWIAPTFTGEIAKSVGYYSAWPLRPPDFVAVFFQGSYLSYPLATYSPDTSHQWWAWLGAAALRFMAFPLFATVTALILARWRLGRHVGRAGRGKTPWNERWPARLIRRSNGWIGAAPWRGDRGLPDAEPVAWRDGRRFGLGSNAGALRTALWLCVPTLLLIKFPGVAEPVPFATAMDWSLVLFCALAGLGALAIVGHGAMAFAGERASQTLEVLLVSPVSAREIVLQKSWYCWRLQMVFGVPLLVLVLWQAVLVQVLGGHDRLVDPGWALGLAALPGLIAYPRVIGWATLYLGMRFRRPRVALLAGLTAVLALVLVPLWYIDPILAPLITGSTDWWKVLAYAASPTLFQILREQRHFYYEIGELWPMTLVMHVLIWLGVAWLLRTLCLAQAERALRRP